MRTATRITAALLALAIVGCGDFPPIEESQTGFRGTAMMMVEDAGELEETVDSVAAAIPELPPPPEAGEPAPPGTWQNVQVLNDVSEEEFFWLMNAMTQWVSPEQGCAYCHVRTEQGNLNLVSDDIYTKVVSRRMIQMTRYINDEWPSHVQEDGINCYSCHRGNPVPPVGNWYFTDADQIERYYLDRPDARVQDMAALATETDNRSSVKQTEWTYALMIQMSGAVGANCTYCHQSSRFGDWEESTAARVTALRGARMTRELNMDWLVPLQDEWPPVRLGPKGDGPKLQCASCHQGAYLPLYGSPEIHAVESLYPRGEGTDQTAPADTAGAETPGDGGADQQDGESGQARAAAAEEAPSPGASGSSGDR